VEAGGGRGALAFETCHPVVPAVYFAGVIGIGVFVLQPVFAALSVAGALCFAVCCAGWRGALAQLRWQLPMVALVCLANPLFSQSGVTVLCTLGPVTVRLEALAYGLCMGASLVSMLQWVANAARVLTEDRLLGLSGTRLPVVTTMVSMAIQLVPQLRRRFGVVESARGACTAAKAPRKGGRVHASTVLMAWAMEDSLERADSMRARGWELGGSRSRYRLEALRTGDVAAAAAVGLLASCGGARGGRGPGGVELLSHHAGAPPVVGLRPVCAAGAPAHGAYTCLAAQRGEAGQCRKQMRPRARARRTRAQRQSPPSS
jgi:energy-coupling factor transport system permease protein